MAISQPSCARFLSKQRGCILPAATYIKTAQMKNVIHRGNYLHDVHTGFCITRFKRLVTHKIRIVIYLENEHIAACRNDSIVELLFPCQFICFIARQINHFATLNFRQNLLAIVTQPNLKRLLISSFPLCYSSSPDSLSADRSDKSSGTTASPVALYKLVIPLLRCEVSDIRDAAVNALGLINHDALK